MTVAPRRAQDGQRLATSDLHPTARPDPLAAAAELPPTLFRLPNLTSSSGDTAAVGQGDSRATAVNPPAENRHNDARSAPIGESPAAQLPAHQSPANQPPAARSAGEGRAALFEPIPDPDRPSSACPLTAESASTGSDVVHRDGQRPTLASVLEYCKRALSDSSNDLPAGRTWMEKFGSHALVLGMLAVVVAAAMLTGRGNDPPTTDDSVANRSAEGLDFDAATDIELPGPTDYATAETPTAETPTANPGLGGEVPAGIPMYSTAAKPAAAKAVAAAATVAGGPAASVQATSLDPPHTTVTPAGSTPIAGSDSGIEFNHFVSPSGGIEATTVSSRTPNDTPPHVPSLEGPGSGGPAGHVSQPNGPHFSRTPFGIADWSAYLPKPAPTDVPTSPT